jgi:hypothetical protein
MQSSIPSADNPISTPSSPTQNTTAKSYATESKPPRIVLVVTCDITGNPPVPNKDHTKASTMTTTQKTNGSQPSPPPKPTGMTATNHKAKPRVEPWWTTVLDHLVQNDLQLNTISDPIDPAIIDLVAFYRTQSDPNLIPN